MVDKNSLHQAIGLPMHDHFDRSIFQYWIHNETEGPDVEDTDHRSLPAQPQ